MAIVMVLEIPDGTIEQYEQVNEIMGVHDTDSAPDGLIGHVCAPTDTGLLIVDVWESQEALDAFFAGRLGAALAQANVPEAMPRVYPVHNGIRGRSAAAA